MRSIRGGMGLGDALYVQSVARHLVASGEKLMVMTAWPDVFRPLNGSVELRPFSRAAQITAHYTSRKGKAGTSQFEDVCINSGLREPIELKLDWAPRASPLVGEVRAAARGRPVVLVQMMRPPMGRRDKFGASLLPRAEAVQACADALRGRCYLVEVGAGRRLHHLRGIDADLTGRTSVPDLIDLAADMDGCLGYVSYMLPLAESLGKRGLYVWARAGTLDRQMYVRQITPEKVIHRKDLATVVWDDAPPGELRRVADAFMR